MKDSSRIINTALENKKINNEAFLEMLASSEKLLLYKLISEKPRTASELFNLTEIPKTSLYRSLTWLLENGLIKGMRHRKIYLNIYFYPIIKNALIEFEQGNLNITIISWGKTNE